MVVTRSSDLKVAAIIQARMGSTRLPNKSLLPIGGVPSLLFLIVRLQKCSTLDAIVVATSTESQDDVLALYVDRLTPATIYRGSEHDVLHRVTKAAQAIGASVIVDITADCPLVDVQMVDEMVTIFIKNYEELDYISNVFPQRTVPDGLDIQVYSTKVIEYANIATDDLKDKAHAGWNVPTNVKGARMYTYGNPAYSDSLHITLTLDTWQDLLLLNEIAIAIQNIHISPLQAIRHIGNHPGLLHINAGVGRKEPGDG